MLGTGCGLSTAILVSNLLLFSQVSKPKNRFVCSLKAVWPQEGRYMDSLHQDWIGVALDTATT